MSLPRNEKGQFLRGIHYSPLTEFSEGHIPWTKGKKLGRSPRNKQVPCVCKKCGTTFYIKPSQVRRGRGKFCCKQCMRLWRSENICGSNHPFYGKHHTPEANLKNRFKHTGKTHSLSDEAKKRIKESNIKTWSKIETIERWLKATRIVPSKPERILIKIIEQNGLPFEYTGNQPKTVGALHPDFMHISDTKVIEVFGDYWHNPETNPSLEGHRTEGGRINAYRYYGYKCLVLWESEIYTETEGKIVEQIRAFCDN